MQLLGLPALLAGLILSFSPFYTVLAQNSASESAFQFSHKRHLALAGLNCENCHYSAKTSQQVSDDNLPKKQVCSSCHDGIHALKHENGESDYAFKRASKPLRFNHQQHLALGNVAPVLLAAIDSGTYLGSAVEVRQNLETEDACEACHRGLRASEVTGQMHYPAMADCLACHTTINPPFSCELCHTRDARIKPASHTPNYMDVHSSRNAKLDKPSCKICHGTRFRCMGCH